MENSSNSDNPKKVKEPKKSSSKKRNRRKDPHRIIEDIMKKASFAYDLERQMKGTRDIMRVLEESDWVHKEMNRFTGQSLNDVLGLSTLGEAARLATERARDVLESIARYPLDQLNRYQELMKNSVYFRPLKDVIGDFSEKYAWMDSLKINPTEKIIEDIEGIHNIRFKDIFNITSEMKKFYANLPDDEIIVQDDQSLSCAGKAYAISDIEKALREKLENSGFLTDQEIGKENFDALLSGLDKIGDPSLKSIIYSFLISMFVSIIIVFVTPHLEHMQKNLLSQDKATVTKFIEREFPKVLPDENKDLLYDLRFVTADVLNVRIKDYQRSKLIGKLYFKSIVRVIQKKKNWTLVEWKDQDSDSVIQGWVFSRYLKKFKI